MTRAGKQSQDTAGPPPRRAWAAVIGPDAALLGHAAFARAGFDDPTLVLRWREIAGPEVAQIAQPLRISQSPSGAVLTLRCDPAAAVFLQHETRPLCARINSYLGRTAVERLRFVPGEIATQPVSPPRNNPQNNHPQDSRADDPVSQYAGDDRLKSALLALARVRHRM